MKTFVKLFVLSLMLILLQLAGTAQIQKPQYPVDKLNLSELKTKFFQLCDVAVEELKIPPYLPVRKTTHPGKERTVTFWMDSYAVRALAVAYDLTGKEEYLNAIKNWSDMMITYQEKMIPKGGYYMNYGRGPWETAGNWYCADCGEISMGVLATAVRCNNPMEKQRYIKSVESFANLVLENYIGPNGGITDGFWPLFDGETAFVTTYVGQVFFKLYDETGDQRYLDAGLNAVNCINNLRLLRNISKDSAFLKYNPIPFREESGSVHTTLSLYNAGFAQLFSKKYPEIEKSVKENITYFVKWAYDNLCGNGYSGQFEKYLHPKPHASIAANPCHIYFMVHNKIIPIDMLKLADKELQRCVSEVFSYDKLWLTGFASFTMMSMAEKICPGAVFRNSQPLYKTVETIKKN
jgi:hypothetical protein